MSSSVIAILGGFVAFLSGVVAIAMGASGGRQHSERQKRLDILEKALERPDLDAALRREILGVLAREHEPQHRPAAWRSVSFGVGWLLFVMCGGVLALDFVGVVRNIDERTVGPLALLGLGLLSLPVALREMTRRDGSLANQR